MKKVLITDSLFIQSKHEQMLRHAGIEFERLDLPAATEDQVIEKIADKEGYILGGTERVTKKIVEAGKKLEAIVFTGIGYKGFIPAWEYATNQGIAIANTPDAPTHAVAEWAVTMALAMNRSIFDLGRYGKEKFKTTLGIEGLKIGFVGFGRINSHIAEMLLPFRPASFSYFSPRPHDEAAKKVNASYTSLQEVLSTNDIIFLGVSDDAGKKFIGASELALIQSGALIVSYIHGGIVDETALFQELSSGRIRAASDHPLGDEYNKLPVSHWFNFQGSNAFNTKKELVLTSDTATQALINILKTGDDKYIVNPEFRKYKK